MATEARISEDESASQKIIPEKGFSTIENTISTELSTSNKSPTEHTSKSEHCQVDKTENLSYTKLSEDEKRHITETPMIDVEATDDKVEANNETVDIEEFTHHTEKHGAQISMQACTEEPMTDQCKSPEVIEESTRKGMTTSHENENIGPKGKEDADLECIEQFTSTTKTNMGLISEAHLSNLDLTPKSQGAEGERVEETCVKDETNDPANHFEDQVKELSLDVVEKKKEDMPSLLKGECMDPESIQSSDKLENGNDKEDASIINVEELGFDAPLKIGDNAVDKLENPYSNQVTDGVSAQVASTICRNKIKDISEDGTINLENRDSQPKNSQDDRLKDQSTLITEETEAVASRENAESRVEQNILLEEGFEKRGEKDEPTSAPYSERTFISTEKMPPPAESITKIKGEENMIPQQIANDLNSLDPLVGETGQLTGQLDTTDIPEDSKVNLEKQHEEESDSHPKDGQEDQLGEQAILIPEDTGIKVSRENAEKRVEQNPFHVEEFEEIGEIDESATTPDSGETSISTEKMPPLAESVTEIKGEENMIPQQIANNLNFTDPLVGDKGQPQNTNISEESIINFEKHHEERRDSEYKNEEDQLGEKVTLVQEEIEIEASRENTERRAEQNNLPVQEFEERGEMDEPTSISDSWETSISTEKIPSLPGSITKIKGEDHETSQEIANDLNSTDSLVGETGQLDGINKVPKTEAREEHPELSKFYPEINEPDEHVSEKQSTKHLIVKHMDSEATVTTDTITKLTEDTEEPQKVPDSQSEDETHIKGEEKIISEGTTEGEESINKQLFATESVTEDEDPSRVTTLASSRDDTVEQSSHEESLKDGERTLTEENEHLRPKDEAEENKQAAEVFDIPYTRGGQHIYEQQIEEGSGEESLNSIQGNEKQIQNMRKDPHEEIKGENQISDCNLGFIQHTGLEEVYPTAIHLCGNLNECASAEPKSLSNSSSLDKSPTENICGSEPQILTESENERQHQNEVEESNPKVHEEETSIDNKHLDQHLELITDQHATLKVIPTRTEKDITSQTNENTTPKRDEDADLECNRQGANIFEKSCKEINLTELQNEKASQVRENDCKDQESSRSSDKTEHENKEEFTFTTSSTEDASSTITVSPSPYIHSVEASSFEAPSNNEDNDKEKLENISSSLLADEENTQAAIEVGETMQDASNATCQDKNHRICESVRQEIDVTPVDDSPKADDPVGENKENIQIEFPDNNEESKINVETHDGEKRDLDHESEQENQVGEQAHQILENIEIEASRENDGKKTGQNIPAEDFDVKEPTFATNTGETSISTEGLSLVESISEINNEEGISPQQIADNLNTNGPLVEETGQPYSGDIVSKIEAPEEHQESSEFCVECNKQQEHHSETQSTDNMIIKQLNPIVTTETVSESIKDIEEINKCPLSHSEEKKDIEKDEKIIPEESKEMEEAIDKQSHETARESIFEDQAPSGLLTITSIRDEAIEQRTIEETLNDNESTSIEKNENHCAENDAKEKIKAVQAPELSEATGSKENYDQQIMEGSMEEAEGKFQYNEKHNEDTKTEIRGETHDISLPYEVNQNNELKEGHFMAAQLESNPNKYSPSELESSVEPSSHEKPQTETNLGSEQFQVSKAEAITDTGIKEPDHDIEHDSEKSSTAIAQKSNLKVHGEELSIDNSNVDQHLKVFTDQHASFEVIPKRVEKEMITSQPKREEDADLECSDQVTSTYDITLDKTSDASFPNPELTITSTSKEDKTAIDSLTKDQSIETTKYVEDETTDLSLTRIKNREVEMKFLQEAEQNDFGSIGSSNKLEYENNREEDASTTNIAQVPRIHNDEESINEAATEDADNDENNWETPSSNSVTDGASLQEEEILQEASHKACKDKDKDTSKSVWPEEDVPPVAKMIRLEDSTYQDQDAEGANEEDINQAGLRETIEDSRLEDSTNQDQLVRDITDSSLVPSYGEHKTMEMSKTTENTLARENVLCIETGTPSIPHTNGSSMSASSNKEKGKEYSNEEIQKHNNEDQPITPDLKAENITLESDTGGIVKEREQTDGLAYLNEAHKLEIVKDEKPTIEVTKTLLQEEELTEKTEDSSTVIGVEREAAKLKTTSGSQKKYLNTKSGELLMEQDDFLAKDQSKEILLHSNNIQTKGKDNNLQDHDSQSLQGVPALNLEPRCNDEDLLNSPLDQDENINAIKITHEVEVSTSKLTEQTESTMPTEGEKPETLDSQSEQTMENTDLRALKSSDASASNIDDSSSTLMVYEKETDASLIKKEDSTTDDPKIVPVIVEIEETGHIEYEKGSILVSVNEDETAITTNKTTSDSIDIIGKEEIFKSEKKETLKELNEGNLKVDSCVMETDKTTTVQQEREQSISTISMSQDYPAPLIEENVAMGNANIHSKEAKSTRGENSDEAAKNCHMYSIEIIIPEKEHEVVKPGGISDLESVNIMKECSYGDSPQPNIEVNEEMVLVEASEYKANSTHEDSETVQGQGNKDPTFQGSLTNVAIENAKAELENEPTDEVPLKKISEAADTNQKVQLASESTAEDRRDENICEAEGKTNCEDNVCEIRNDVPEKCFQGGIQREATLLGGCTENVAAATVVANGIENILEHNKEPTGNMKQGEGILVEERESRISENLANANEDFSFTSKKASEEGLHTECEKENKAEVSNKDDTHTTECLPCLHESNDVTTIDEVAKTEMQSSEDDNDKQSQERAEGGCEGQHEEKSEATKEGKYGSTKDNIPDDEDGKNVTNIATELTHENQGTEPQRTGSSTAVINQGEKNQEVEADRSQKEHIDTAEVSESTREIHKMEECSLGERDIKDTVITDADIGEINEDVEQGLHKPDEVIKPEIHLEEAKSTNIRAESRQVEEENIRSSTEEPLREAKHSNEATILATKAEKAETPQCEEAKAESEEDKRENENETVEALPSVANEDFYFTTKEASEEVLHTECEKENKAEVSNKDDTHTSESLPCVPERNNVTTIDEVAKTEMPISEDGSEKKSQERAKEGCENQHGEKAEIDNPPDDDGQNVTKVATELTHENEGTEPKIAGSITVIMNQGEKNQEVEVDSSEKEHIVTAEVSESTREIQKLEEISLEERDSKVTVKADAEIKETNEDLEQGFHKAEIHLEEKNLADDEDGKNVTKIATELTHESQGTELKRTGSITAVINQGEKEVEADSSQKEHIDTAEVSLPTREIQNLAEVIKPEIHLEEAKSTNITVESRQVEEENVRLSTEEPLQEAKYSNEETNLAAKDEKAETPQCEEAKAESEEDKRENENKTVEALTSSGANANEDFSFTTKEASEEGLHTECETENKAEVSNKDDTHTSESLPCLPGRNDVTTIDEVSITEMQSSEDDSEKKSQERAEGGCQNQHEENEEATKEGEYGKTIDNPSDDENGKNVTKVATELTHENQGTEPKRAGSITAVIIQGEMNQEAEADSSQKEHIDTAEVSKSTREIQNLEECSLGEMDMKVTVKTDANIIETNQDVEQGLHKPDEVIKPEIHLEEAKSTNITVESRQVEEENVQSSTEEPLQEAKHSNEATILVAKAEKAETPQCEEEKAESEEDKLENENKTVEALPSGATDSGFIEQGGEMCLVEERKSRVSENIANSNEDFSFTTKEASEEGLHTECEKENKAEVSNKDDPRTSESLPCLPERNDVTTIDEVAKTEIQSSEDSSEKKSQERAEGGCENQHEEKAEATEEGEYGKTIDNPPDDGDGKNVTKVATEVTHENQGSITVVMNQGEKNQEVEADSLEKEHIDTRESSESTREIQKLEEISLEERDLKAEAEIKESNENVQSSTEESPQEAKHLDEATDLTAKAEKIETPKREEAKAESEEDEHENDNERVEQLPSGAAVMVEIPKDEEEKLKHKKSHNILSGVGSKVKHSISKVKKAITGKSSHTKTSPPK